MYPKSKAKIQAGLEKITRKWWFFLFFFILQLLPPYASRGFNPEEFGIVIGEILSNCFVFRVPFFYPLFKILPFLLVVLIFLKGDRTTRTFSAYAALNYTVIAVLQSVGESETYGFGIVFTNLIMFLLVAASWLLEAIVKRNDFSKRKIDKNKLWVIAPAVLAFWYPANSSTFLPDFSPIGIFSNSAGLAFCMMTPVYLAVLILFYPKINYVTMRVTGLVGTIIGLYNVSLNFLINFKAFWWNGLLHIPLLALSLSGIFLSFKKIEANSYILNGD